MGVSAKRAQFIHRARELYAEGMRFKEIGEAIGVDRDTVRAWYAYDRKRGTSWDEELDREQDTRPERIMKLLERRFGNMVLQSEKHAGDEAKLGDDYEVKLLRMTQVIKGYRKSADELTGDLLALERFAVYCSRNLPRQDIAVVRAAIARYTESLRKENS